MDRRQFLSSFTKPRRNHLVANATHSTDRWIPSNDNAWNSSAAKHLLHRLGLAPTKSRLQQVMAMDPHEYIDHLFDDDLLTTLMPAPPDYWEKWLEVTPYWGSDYKLQVIQDDLHHAAKADMRHHVVRLLTEEHPALRERLTYFWMNHFAVQESEPDFPHMLYWLYMIYRSQCWKSFKQMVKDVTINPAMLMVLDNHWNEKGNINENYARELMELFTMGRHDGSGNPNYTQEDVRSVATALTGWKFLKEAPPPHCLPPTFVWYQFDGEAKLTPFGADAKVYGLSASNDQRVEADIIDTIFEYRGDQVAKFIMSKLYRFFVHRDTTTESAQRVIQGMATRFKQDWEIKPPLELLFHSEHFFDPVFRGGIIKSPHDFMLGALNHLDITITQSQAGSLEWHGFDMDQHMLNPVDVRGWQGHRTWITGATLTKRVAYLDQLIFDGIKTEYISHHTGFVFDYIIWADDAVTKWAEQFQFYKTDFAALTSELCDLFFAIPPSPQAVETIIASIQDFPSYEWPAMDALAKAGVIRRLVYRLMLLPEYQLS
jgi:uncharacterized protein (DUF1800 family)